MKRFISIMAVLIALCLCLLTYADAATQNLTPVQTPFKPGSGIQKPIEKAKSATAVNLSLFIKPTILDLDKQASATTCRTPAMFAVDVLLSHNGPTGDLIIPAKVTIPASVSCATFAVTSKSQVIQDIVVTAMQPGHPIFAGRQKISLRPPPEAKISVLINPAVLDFDKQVSGGTCRTPTTFTVDVLLSHNGPTGDLIVPAKVTIPASANCTTFSVTSKSRVSQDIVVTATQSGHTTSIAKQKITLRPPPAELKSLLINGDSGTGTAKFVNGAQVGLAAYLTSSEPIASVSISTNFTGHNMNPISISNSSVGSQGYTMKYYGTLSGMKKTGTITAEYRGKTITRDVEILPPSQIEKICFFDPTPTAGYYSVTYDYCTHEISPGVIIGSKTANGFVRRGFASPEPVRIELSSSDPSLATVSPASLIITGINPQQRGGLFIVTTKPTGGVPRNIIIKVVEGSSWEKFITLTIQ